MNAPQIIAEAGVNHNGRLQMAIQLVDAAAAAGADVVKFQTFTAHLVVAGTAPKARYQVDTTNANESQLEMLSNLGLSSESFYELARRCEERMVEFMSTPFDLDSVDVLESIGVRRFKIPSGEITHSALLRKVAATGKPVILSTGMSGLGEVEVAIDELTDAGCTDLTLLHCTSNYPTRPCDVNLRAMETLQRTFGLPVGYSDHTRGTEVAVAAAALGASIIEKHFTLDRELPGPDHRASLEPAELAAMIGAIRNVVTALGDARKRPVASERGVRDAVRRSLVTARPLSAGTVLTDSDLVAKRPGTGIPPNGISTLVGRTLRRNLAEDTLITWADVGL